MSFLRFFVFFSCAFLLSPEPPPRSSTESTINAIYNKKLFTVEDGLSQGYITCLHEDHNGYLWVGTLSGLNRFDGKRFESFIENPNDSFSVKGQYVDQILEDQQHRVWILFNNGSISIYDEDKKRFHSIILDGYEENDIRNSFTLVAHEDQLWIRQTYKIGRLTLHDENDDRATWKAEVSYVTIHDEDQNEATGIRDLFFDGGGRLWLSTLNNVFIIDEPYDHSAALRARDFHFTSRADTMDHFALLKEGSDTFWINTWQGDLVQVSGGVVLDQSRYDLSALHGGIMSLVRDDNGIIWMETWGRAALFDTQERVFYETDFNSTCLLKSSDGTIWSGTEGYGLYRFSPNNCPFINIGNDGFGIEPGQEMVSGPLMESRSGELLMLKKTVLRFNEQTGEWNDHLPWFEGFEESGRKWPISAYLEDSRGRSWLTYDGGVYCLEVDGRTTVHTDHSTYMLGVIEDDEEKIWLIGSGELLGFDEEKQEFVAYSYQIKNPPSRENSFNSYLDHEGKLWLATEMGLYLFDKELKDFERKWIDINGIRLKDVAFSALHQDQTDPTKIWVGTKNKGLFIYDLQQELWSVPSHRDGLTNNTIYGIAQDAFNRTWMSTNAGIFVYDSEERSWMNFRKENGIQGNEFNSRSFVQMNDGKLYMGGMNGVTGFYPSGIQNRELDHPILLKSFAHEQQKGDSTQVNLIEDLTVEVQLSYQDARRLEIEFVWLNYDQSENHKYAYRLGKDEEWIDLNDQNKLSFYNLSAGKYNLQVKATDWMGNTNQSLLMVPFTILAPWYKTGWAYATYLLLGIALITLIFRVREHRRRLELEAVYNRNEAERFKDIEQTKSRFFSNITHELKTPLTLVIGPLEQLYEHSKSVADRSLIHTVKKNAADLLYLINQLLDLNKIEQGKMPIDYSSGDLALFVNEICSKSRHLADSKGIRLNFHSTPESIQANFDSRKVERIVINLLSNALKFSPENTTVKVNLDQRGNSILLQVQDEGPGIPVEKLESVFDPFYQLDGSEKRKHGGTGIGLSLVKEYTELLGATVSVKNNPDVGCTFSVVFPMVDVLEASEVEVDVDISGLNVEFEKASEPTASQPSVDGTPLVLIAEDNKELNNYLKSCLGNYSVIQAFNGNQAWQLIQEHLPDLVLSDNMMPEMTGLELCAKVKDSDLTSHIPVIILTAKSAIENRVEGLSAGADDYLSKPFNQTELLVRIENLIGLRRALREKYESSMQSVKLASTDQSLSAKDKIFIERAEAIIEANLDNGEFDVIDFVDSLNLSRSQAHRKIKALTNVSVSVFIRSYRLKRAMEMMQTDGLIVKEAAYRVGFNSPSYFSKCFHEQFGIPPTQLLS